MLLTGSAGGGKSTLAAEKLVGYCLCYPAAMALMVRKTRESMTNSTVLFMDRTVLQGVTNVRHYPSKNRFEFGNGSILAYGGMKNEEQREQIRSMGQQGGVDIAWMEEANKFLEDDFQEVLARMRGSAAPWQQLVLSTNPDSPLHWINRRLIQGGEASTYFSAAAENPHNAPGYLDMLGRLTGIMEMRLVRGLWVQAEGAVYPQFGAAHQIGWFEPPREWRRIRAIDFGYTNPFVCQWWAIDPDGRMYLYREIYRSQRLVEDHARDIVGLTGTERIEATPADHDAEDRATLERYGVHTSPAKKAVSPGIQAVEQRLRKAGDGRPRIFFMRGALVEEDKPLSTGYKPTSTVEEFAGYAWPESKDSKPAREIPVQVDDHGLDAMRYAVMYLDGDVAAAGIVIDDLPASTYKAQRRSRWG